jgi:endonuclease G, mitochondrial
MPVPLERFAAPVLALLLAALPLVAQEPFPQVAQEPVPPEAARHVRFGMPGPAKADPRDREHYLIARPQYVLSYNAEKRTANWVSWSLRESDIGSAARAPFEPDPDLPRGFARVTSNVYSGGGFDRGVRRDS